MFLTTTKLSTKFQPGARWLRRLFFTKIWKSIRKHNNKSSPTTFYVVADDFSKYSPTTFWANVVETWNPGAGQTAKSDFHWVLGSFHNTCYQAWIKLFFRMFCVFLLFRAKKSPWKLIFFQKQRKANKKLQQRKAGPCSPQQTSRWWSLLVQVPGEKVPGCNRWVAWASFWQAFC